MTYEVYTVLGSKTTVEDTKGSKALPKLTYKIL